MPKIVINNCEYICHHMKDISHYNCNYYWIENNYKYGDCISIGSDLVIREECDEAYNSLTISLGYINYLNGNKFVSLLELCDGYNEKIDFGNIIWKDDLYEE